MATPWPDLEAALVAHLAFALAVPVATSTPDDLEKRPEFVRVIAEGGADDGLTDSPSLDVEAFAPSRGEARRLAERARCELLNLQGKRRGGVLFDAVTTVVRPTWVDYRNPKVHRFVATFAVAFRPY